MHTHSKIKVSLLALLLLTISQSGWALNIFACEPEWASLARSLAPQATIFSATTTYQDPHMIQARPSLIAKLRQADLAICTGAELEIGWLPALQQKANNSAVRSTEQGLFFAADQVERLDKLNQVDRSMGDVHASGNPHVHLDPERILQISVALANRLQQLDPEHALHYQQNQQTFAQQLQAQLSKWQDAKRVLAGQQVIAYHSSFRYLFAQLGIEQVADLEPKPGLPPSSRHLEQLLAKAQQQSIIAVIYTPYQDSQGAKWLADKLQVPAIELPFTVDDAQDDSLLALYQRQLQSLLALKGQP